MEVIVFLVGIFFALVAYKISKRVLGSEITEEEQTIQIILELESDLQYYKKKLKEINNGKDREK